MTMTITIFITIKTLCVVCYTIVDIHNTYEHLKSVNVQRLKLGSSGNILICVTKFIELLYSSKHVGIKQLGMSYTQLYSAAIGMSFTFKWILYKKRPTMWQMWMPCPLFAQSNAFSSHTEFSASTVILAFSDTAVNLTIMRPFLTDRDKLHHNGK
jgi:hypothetical protein